MKRIYTIILPIVFLVLFTIELHALNSSKFDHTKTDTVKKEIPIHGGVGLLLAAGIVYTTKRIFAQKPTNRHF